MVSVSVFTDDRALVDSLVKKLSIILPACGVNTKIKLIIPRVRPKQFKQKPFRIQFQYIRLSPELKKTKPLFSNALDRFYVIMHRLLTKPWKGEMLFPQPYGDAKVQCSGKLHRIYATESGHLDIPSHQNEEIELDRAMSVLAQSKNARCIRILDAWRRGTLFEKGIGQVSLPGSVSWAYQRVRQNVSYRKRVRRTLGTGEKRRKVVSPSVNPVEERWVDTAMHEAARVLTGRTGYYAALFGSVSYMAGGDTQHLKPIGTNNQILANMYNGPIRVAAPGRPKIVTHYQKKLDFSDVVVPEGSNAYVELAFCPVKDWRGTVQRHDYSLGVYFKSAAKWYSTVYLAGIAEVEGVFILERVSKDSDTEYTVKAAKLILADKADKATQGPVTIVSRLGKVIKDITTSEWRFAWTE